MQNIYYHVSNYQSSTPLRYHMVFQNLHHGQRNSLDGRCLRSHTPNNILRVETSKSTSPQYHVKYPFTSPYALLDSYLNHPNITRVSTVYSASNVTFFPKHLKPCYLTSSLRTPSFHINPQVEAPHIHRKSIPPISIAAVSRTHHNNP